MSRMVYQAHCPGCGKRIRAPSEDLRRARVLRHVRNCNALQPADRTPFEVVAPPGEPQQP